MRKPISRGFDVEEMIKLRVEGWSFSALGERYNKDHTTIMYHCRKHGVVVTNNEVVVQAKAKVKIAPGNPTWDQYLREHYCCGSRGRYRHLVYCPAYGTPPPPLPAPKKPHKYDYIFDEPINRGKSYQEYLADALKRPAEKQYHEVFGNIFDTPPAGLTRHRNSLGQFEPEDLVP